MQRDYEIILVDDGSEDESPEIRKELASHDSHIKAVILYRNCGSMVRRGPPSAGTI